MGWYHKAVFVGSHEQWGAAKQLLKAVFVGSHERGGQPNHCWSIKVSRVFSLKEAGTYSGS